MALALWTDNVDKAFADLVHTGVVPPHDSGNSNRKALICDPDGNLVELVSKTP
jgi:lactoylglutathione lyase